MRKIDWKTEYCDETAGIYIRPIELKDAADIVRWRNSEGVRKHFIYQGLLTLESQIDWIENHVKTGEVAQMIICRLSDDVGVGSVYLRDINETHSKAEYGVLIGEEEYRGRGIGSAVARLMPRFGFEELGLHRIYLRALAGNDRAIKSYENAGFVREGLLKEDVCINGAYRDVVWMAMVKD